MPSCHKFAMRVSLNEIIGVKELGLRTLSVNVHFLLSPTTTF